MNEGIHARRGARGLLRGFAVACVAMGLCAGSEARQVFDPLDPAFAGAASVPLPPAGIPAGAIDHRFQVNGVTFSFRSTTTPANALASFGSIAVFSLSGPGEGVLVTASRLAVSSGSIRHAGNVRRDQQRVGGRG